MATTIEDAGAARPTQIRVRIVEGRPFVSDFPFRLKSGQAWPTAPALAFAGPSGTIQWPSTLSDGGKLATVTATKAEVDTLLGPNRQSGSVELNDVPTGRMWAHGRYFSLPSNWQGGADPVALADGAVIVDDRLVIMGTGDGSGTITSVAWTEVTGKPSSYPPSSHRHDASEIDNLPSGGTVSDATTTTKGVVQLAGDLGGTADTPTVPGLAGKANTAHTHSGYAATAHNHDTAYAAKSAELGRYTGINAQTGTTYTPVVADEGKLITLNNAGAITVTLPPDSTAIPVGGSVDFCVIGAGMATFVAGSGATVNGTPSLVTRAQWSTVTAIKRAANAWLLVGDLADA